MSSAPELTAMRVTGGPPGWEPERLASHRMRLGALPARDALYELEASGLQGRGGAAFPAGRKWRAVAERGGGEAAIVVNGAEGEPLSEKDHFVMRARPHLVLDGVELAVRAIGARDVFLYAARDKPQASAALAAALAERGGIAGAHVTAVGAPPRFVAGEETAAIHFLEGGDAKPVFTPPRPFERGVGGRPTLVGNVETFAHAALIARYGAGWFRSAGTASAPGTFLVTVGGAVARPGVTEVAGGSPLAELVAAAGGDLATSGPVLLGGFFGAWLAPAVAATMRYDPADTRRARVRLGAGVVHVLARETCGVAETARILGYLAAESARQCGPCEYGLAALAAVVDRLARGAGRPDDLRHLRRWVRQLAPDRGACRHPDGAVGLLRSALDAFGPDFEWHASRGACSYAYRPRQIRVPPPRDAWR